MNGSMRFSPNVAKGGDCITLMLEGLTKPDDVKNKTITIEIIEVDKGRDGGAAGKTDDILATFECGIDVDETVNPRNYFFRSVTRTDTFESSLPSPEVRTATDGTTNLTLSFTPEWIPPYIYISFEGDPQTVGPQQAFTVLFFGDANERENYIYELAARLKVEKTVIADTTPWPSPIDCNNLLAHNCRQATLALYNDHRELVSLRGIGTHYGSNYTPSDNAVFNTQKTTYGLKVMSCIGYLLEAGKLGHEKTSASADWKAILKSLSQGKGTTLAKGLEKAGWLGIYYNPDTKNPFDKNHPTIDWKEHPFSYSIAKQKRQYYGLKVYDLVVDYRPTESFYDGTPVSESEQTIQNTTKIDTLTSIPFGFINVRGGKHTAILIDGEVYEVHWDEGCTSSHLFDKVNFRNDWNWLSGIIHIPKGCWA
jgi:hypothetical protein